MQPTQQKFSIVYVILAFVGLLLMQALLFGPHTENLSYRDFKTLLKADKVEDLAIGERTITGRLKTEGLEGLLPKEKIEELQRFGKGEHRFITVRVEDPALISELEGSGIQFRGQVESNWLGTLLSWILPAVVFVGIWVLVMRRMGAASGMMSIGKSKAKVYVEKETGVTFDDVAGIDEARAELMEIVDFLQNPDRYRRLGGKIPKGALLVGAPGTGKTLLAKAVAGEAGVPFFSLSGSDFVEMFVGVGAARVRDLFAQAQERAPSIIFIDELDALGKARGISPITGGHDEREQTLNQLLSEMDGFDTQKGVIILAATNRPEILDPALLRPGRFDRQIVIDRPDLKGREKILQVHTRQVTLAPEVDLSLVAARTPGFVGADLANLVNEAALRAAREGKAAVEMADFDEAIDRVVAGIERKSRVISPREKQIVAYHEAGHALVAESRAHADRVAKISLIPRGVAALGYTQQQPTEDRYLMTRGELLERLDVLLGGRVAEEIIFGDVSTGAQDDLQRATDLVRHMITRYGMSEALGLATFEGPRQALFLQVPAGGAKEYSEETARLIDAEIHKLLEESRTRVRQTLTAKRSVLEALAKLLMEQEVVDRQALTQLLAVEQPA
jgi:cell division protease FtsH